ncbi:MAG TPA: hypothetical protein VLF18_03515 [Tahibacter sp.]|uniref:hypothetical protein n=1 Tax=Tahibacter sp. TaxID=2056211 RepID=UPI002C8B1D2A|nr:hypothetical protein [Tahibacter sp.]HSX59249.1 hypothetical protein [Tahibacter sp.]
METADSCPDAALLRSRVSYTRVGSGGDMRGVDEAPFRVGATIRQCTQGRPATDGAGACVLSTCHGMSRNLKDKFSGMCDCSDTVMKSEAVSRE